MPRRTWRPSPDEVDLIMDQARESPPEPPTLQDGQDYIDPRQNNPSEEDEEEDEETPESDDNNPSAADDDEDEEDEDEDNPGEDEEEEEGQNEDDNDGATLYLSGTPTLAIQQHPALLRDIGHEAVWSLSTAKPGNGVEQIRDLSMDTYWQSDGCQPHLINIQFARRASVSTVAFYLDYNLDESYTPKRLSVRVGMTFHDLVEVRVVELNEPVGWVSVPLRAAPDPLELQLEDMEGDTAEEEVSSQASVLSVAQKTQRAAVKHPIRTHFVQVCIESMHQNGRDTHVRQVKIFGPRWDAVRRRRQVVPVFQTPEMTQFATVR